ncbi:MAG: chorismate mutase [archaeon]
MSLENYRKEFDEIDNQLIELLSKRTEVSIKVGEYKKNNNLPIQDIKREEELLNKLNQLAKKNNLSKTYINQLFKIILQNSRDIQMETVSFDEWKKLDLRTAEILEAEEIPGTDKLYKLKVDLGTETRTLVAGLKQHYTREELSGKKCIVFTNLEPKIIKGIESKGMILAAVNDDGSEIKILQPGGVADLGLKIS